MVKFLVRRFARMLFVLAVTTFGALVAVTELSAMQLGALMDGSVMIEAIFQYPGSATCSCGP